MSLDSERGGAEASRDSSAGSAARPTWETPATRVSHATHTGMRWQLPEGRTQYMVMQTVLPPPGRGDDTLTCESTFSNAFSSKRRFPCQTTAISRAAHSSRFRLKLSMNSPLAWGRMYVPLGGKYF